MKSKTYISLTNEERIVLARASEILDELEEHLIGKVTIDAQREEAQRGLIEVMSFLEDLGNDFRIPTFWREWVEEKIEQDYEPDVEEMMADCFEFIFER